MPLVPDTYTLLIPTLVPSWRTNALTSSERVDPRAGDTPAAQAVSGQHEGQQSGKGESTSEHAPHSNNPESAGRPAIGRDRHRLQLGEGVHHVAPPTRPIPLSLPARPPNGRWASQ